MEGVAIAALICAFLPFLASLGGSGGVWKFLAFLVCVFSLVGAASVIGFGGGVLAWGIAWIFTAIAIQVRRSEDRFARMERNLLAAQRAQDTATPVVLLLQNEAKQQRFISPGQAVALVVIFGLASAMIYVGVADMKTDQGTVSISSGTQMVAAVAPKKVEAQPPSSARKCQVSDFAIEGFSSKVFDDCKQSSCPALKLTGRLKNNCATSAGAQIKITAEDGKGSVVDTTDGWPASTRNIGPGSTYAFDMGPLMRYRSSMKKFSVEVIDVRTW